MRITLTAFLTICFTQATAECGNLCDSKWWETATPSKVQAELDAGSSVFFLDKKNRGMTPLHAAASKGSSTNIQLLIDLGAEVNARLENGWTPLHSAVARNSSSHVQVLLAAGADVTARGKNDWTPLHQASAWPKNAKTLTALIIAGADVMARTDRGVTPLHYSAAATLLGQRTDPSGINANLLIEAGADVNAIDDNGNTPLHNAVTFPDAGGDIKALLNAGADANYKNNDGNTPLHRGARSGSAASNLKFLVEAGSDLNIKNNDGETPLYVAMKKGQPKNFKAILDSGLSIGADVFKPKIDGNSLLHLAARSNRSRTTQMTLLLLKAGADVVAKNNTEQTPLHMAATNIATKNIQYLIKFDADVDAQDSSGSTALHLIGQNTSRLSKTTAAVISKSIMHLLDAEADLKIVNHDGKIAWDYIKKNDRIKATKAYRSLQKAHTN